MKILQIGCGGVGSFLIFEIAECIEQGIIDPFELRITLADQDIVELNQRKYQNFTLKEVGMNKAEALAKRFNKYGVEAFPNRISNEKQLKGYDAIILCVDNEMTRNLVIRHCHKHDAEFIDLRATGRRFFAMPKTTLKDNLRFVDIADVKEYSCQEKSDIEKNYIQKGNKIAAIIGLQMLLNLLRGHSNKTISMMI
ncbi:MAG: ThiF family adenylyltransferase [Nanoarchaeota archaeon]